MSLFLKANGHEDPFSNQACCYTQWEWRRFIFPVLFLVILIGFYYFIARLYIDSIDYNEHREDIQLEMIDSNICNMNSCSGHGTCAQIEGKNTVAFIF